MALNFDNTEVAFSHLTNKALKKSFRLFKLLNNTKISALGRDLTLWAFNLGLPIKNLVKKSIFDAFVGGESIDESKPIIETLAAKGVESILDYGVEAQNEESKLDEIARTLVRKIAYIKEDPNANIASVKITALSRDPLLVKVSTGESLDQHEMTEWERVIERIDMVCRSAFDSNNKVYIDAEESWIQGGIDQLVVLMMKKYNQQKPIVFNTVQLYRHDRLAFLKQQYQEAQSGGYTLAVKLVRGAYMEKENKRAKENNTLSPIHTSKENTDADFNAALEFCIQNIENIAICAATHNEESNYILDELLRSGSIAKDHPHIMTAQLYGMGDHITFNLAKEGYNAGKYLPYGPVKELIPYLIRRAQENSSVDGQTGRELALLRKEMKRRGLVKS